MSSRTAEHQQLPTHRHEQLVERALIVGFGLLYLVVVLRSSTTIDGERTYTLFDDAMISMRYGRNLAEGNGLVYNPGEQVEGYTNLLWTVVMAGVHLVVRSARATSLAVSTIGIAILLAQLELVRRLVRGTVQAPWAAATAMAATGAGFALAFWTLRGMEVGLVGLLITAAIAATHVTPSWTWSTRALVVGALLTAAVFTRDDALVAAVVVLAAAVRTVPVERRPRAALVAAGSVVVVVALRVGLRWALYGEVLPNTYILKVAGVPRDLLLQRGAASTGLLLTFGLVVPLALALLSWSVAPVARTCIAVVGAQLLYAVAVGGDAWEYFGFANRFAATVTAPLMVAAVLGIVASHRGQVQPALRGVSLSLLGLTAVAALVAPSTSSYFGIGHGGWAADAVRIVSVLAAIGGILAAAHRVGVVVLGCTLILAGNVVPTVEWLRAPSELHRNDEQWAAYGAALRDATAPDATIAASAIGNLGYFSERPIADVLGKVDPVVAHSAPRLDKWLIPGHSKWDLDHTVGELRPDVVAQLFAADDADVAHVESLGYDRWGAFLFVRQGAAITSDGAVAAALDRAH